MSDCVRDATNSQFSLKTEPSSTFFCCLEDLMQAGGSTLSGTSGGAIACFVVAEVARLGGRATE